MCISVDPFWGWQVSGQLEQLKLTIKLSHLLVILK